MVPLRRRSRNHSFRPKAVGRWPCYKVSQVSRRASLSSASFWATPVSAPLCVTSTPTPTPLRRGPELWLEGLVIGDEGDAIIEQLTHIHLPGLVSGRLIEATSKTPWPRSGACAALGVPQRQRVLPPTISGYVSWRRGSGPEHVLTCIFQTSCGSHAAVDELWQANWSGGITSVCWRRLMATLVGDACWRRWLATTLLPERQIRVLEDFAPGNSILISLVLPRSSHGYQNVGSWQVLGEVETNFSANDLPEINGGQQHLASCAETLVVLFSCPSHRLWICQKCCVT